MCIVNRGNFCVTTGSVIVVYDAKTSIEPKRVYRGLSYRTELKFIRDTPDIHDGPAGVRRFDFP